MTERINVRLGDETDKQEVDALPDECPLCHRAIHSISRFAIWTSQTNFEAVFQCPHNECQSLFIAYYRKERWMDTRSLIATRPRNFKGTSWSDSIDDISPNFVKIYNQAEHSEALELDQVAGCGYRKALEFLIKDYLTGQEEDDSKKEAIRQDSLGANIKKRMGESPRIQNCAERAAWLGNDETHYARKWKDKDINDLKTLIQLTANSILNEHLETEYMWTLAIFGHCD